MKQNNKFFKTLFTVTLLVLFSNSLSCDAKEDKPLPIQKKEIALVQLSFDGINTFHCGVGTVVLQTMKTLKDFNKKYEGKFKFKLYLISGDYSTKLPEYSLKTLQKNILDCSESGGDVLIIPTANNNQMFGEPKQWEELCKGGSELCAKIINENAFTIIIAHDTSYAHLPLKLNYLALQGKLESPYNVIWVPHATSWSYNGHSPEGLPNWPQRHCWELEAFKSAPKCNYLIGYIGSSMKSHLVNEPFNVSDDSLFFYKTGIILDRYLKSIPEIDIEIELKKRSIPVDKRLIFSIGRATPLKGLDITLEVYRNLKSFYSDIHLVMLAPESDHMPDYIQILKKRIEEEQLPVTLIDTFDSDLANFIYQWPKTAIISLLSRVDTQPLTIMESRANPKNCIVLTSNKWGMGAQVYHKKDGFICPLDGLENIIQKPLSNSDSIERITNIARQILDLSQDEREEIIASGKNLVHEKYDLHKNMLNNLKRLLMPRKNYSPQNNESLFIKGNLETVRDFYFLKGPIFLKRLPGGIVNPPTGIFTKNMLPIGVFKSVLGSPQLAAVRLKVLDKIKSKGFIHLPRIIMNKKNQFLTNIGNSCFYFLQFIPQDDNTVIDFDEFLKITIQFHSYAKKLQVPEVLKISKLDEYRLRSKIFNDPWFVQNKPNIFRQPIWNKIISLGNYLSSENFQSIYKRLPAQIIHGDNNQTNVIISNKIPYLIDLDTLRFDVRLLDFASFFRYGGFQKYLELSKNGNLSSYINNFYKNKREKLTTFEERNFHLIVAFSHLEFLSWSMESLKQAKLNENKQMEKQFLSYIATYIDQLQKLIEFIKF